MLDFRNKFIILEIGLLKVLYFDPLGFLLIKICSILCFFGTKALYFDPLGFLLIKICNVLCFVILLFGKKISFRTGTEITHNQVIKVN